VSTEITITGVPALLGEQEAKVLKTRSKQIGSQHAQNQSLDSKIPFILIDWRFIPRWSGKKLAEPVPLLTSEDTDFGSSEIAPSLAIYLPKKTPRKWHLESFNSSVSSLKREAGSEPTPADADPEIRSPSPDSYSAGGIFRSCPHPSQCPARDPEAGSYSRRDT
jgi:hypothetical protein